MFLFDLITEEKNLRKAYLDLIKKFDEQGKSRKYVGIDATTLNDLNYFSEEILREIRQETIEFKPISPAYKVAMPKKRSGKRNIYIFSIKERIKAESAYRILEPVFDKFLSPYLFSYRRSRPSYYAARSAVRRYKRFYGQNHVLVADLADYTDSIDHEFILKKLSALDMDDKTKKLLSLFIKSPCIINGKIHQSDHGLLTGTPLTGLLANLFLDEFDKWAGKFVSFYRRVGDDIIAIDKSSEKIKQVKERLIDYVKNHKLNINSRRLKMIKDTEEFNFLGYRFKDGLIGFEKPWIRKNILAWEKELSLYRGDNLKRKLAHFQKVFFHQRSNVYNEFDQIVFQKLLVDDINQVKYFSNLFFRLLTSYFYGNYTEKKHRKLKDLLRDYRLPSLFNQFHKVHFSKR